MSAIPACFDEMLAAWGEREEGAIRQRLERAVAADVAFVDPHYDIRGIDPFVQMILAFHQKYPGATLGKASGIDMHHDRARYAWRITFANGAVFDGFDAVRVDLASGKVARVDGFFGPLPPL